MSRVFRTALFLRHLVWYGTFSLLGCMQGGTGTEIGNPATVTGKVYDINDNVVANAVVFLVSPDYNAVLDSIGQFDSITYEPGRGGSMVGPGEMRRVSTRTNSKGEFVFDSVAPHSYNLFIADSTVSNIGFKPHITINAIRVNLGDCEIRSVGYATVMVYDSIFRPDGFISLPGTPIKKAVDSAGEYTVPVIYDTLTVNYYDRSGDTLAPILSEQLVPVVASGDTIDLTGIETIIIPPVVVVVVGNDTLYSPVDSLAVYDTLIQIAAIGATVNKKSLIEYQFYDVTRQRVSAWSTDKVFSLHIDTNQEYSVACRVRSRSDTLAVSSWTPALRIRLKHSTEENLIPTPSAPVPIDTFSFGDSLAYRFFIPVDTAAFTFNYRLSWRDTMEFHDVSPWSRDSVCTVRFPAPGMFLVQAQVQNVQDTSRMSLWSDTLLFVVNP